MTDTPTLPENGAHLELRARSLAQLDRLDELAEIGMKAARLVGVRADTAAPEEDLNGLAMAYSRAARAVRLCVMLHAKIVKDLGDRDRAGRETAKVAHAAEREERKAEVEHLVYRRVERAHGDDLEAIERLMEETAERLDNEDFYGDLMSRPIGEMADEISRLLDLGEPADTEPARQDRRAPTDAEWSDALAKAAAEAEKVLAELRADSS